MPEQDTSSFFLWSLKSFSTDKVSGFLPLLFRLENSVINELPSEDANCGICQPPSRRFGRSAVIIASYLDVLWCSLVLLCQEGARGRCSIRKRNCKPSKVTKPAKAMVSAHNALSWNGSFRNHQVQPTCKLIMNISMDGEALSNLFQMFYHSHYKKLLPYIESKSTILSFKDITPCPISTCPCKTFLSLSFYKFSLGTGRLL